MATTLAIVPAVMAAAIAVAEILVLPVVVAMVAVMMSLLPSLLLLLLRLLHSTAAAIVVMVVTVAPGAAGCVHKSAAERSREWQILRAVVPREESVGSIPRMAYAQPPTANSHI